MLVLSGDQVEYGTNHSQQTWVGQLFVGALTYFKEIVTVYLKQLQFKRSNSVIGGADTQVGRF